MVVLPAEETSEYRGDRGGDGAVAALLTWALAALGRCSTASKQRSPSRAGRASASASDGLRSPSIQLSVAGGAALRSAGEILLDEVSPPSCSSRSIARVEQRSSRPPPRRRLIEISASPASGLLGGFRLPPHGSRRPRRRARAEPGYSANLGRRRGRSRAGEVKTWPHRRRLGHASASIPVATTETCILPSSSFVEGGAPMTVGIRIDKLLDVAGGLATSIAACPRRR